MRLIIAITLSLLTLTACDSNDALLNIFNKNKLSDLQNEILNLSIKANKAEKESNKVNFYKLGEEIESIQQKLRIEKKLENWGCYVEIIETPTNCKNPKSKSRIICYTEKMSESEKNKFPSHGVYEICTAEDSMNIENLKRNDFIYFTGKIKTNEQVLKHCKGIGCSFQKADEQIYSYENNEIYIQLYGHQATLEAKVFQ